MHEQLSPGYYNFYWDKKDDSDLFVPAGTYTYLVETCGDMKSGEITAAYLPGELACTVEPDKDYNSLRFLLHVLNDSTSVSLQVFDRREQLVAEPFKDSLFSRGDFPYTWSPDASVGPSIYKFIVTVGEFPHVFYRRYAGR